MANFAFVENDQIQGVYDLLPKNWKNISNFSAIDNEEKLKSYGWYKIKKQSYDFDETTHKLSDWPKHTFVNGEVIEERTIERKKIPVKNTIQQEWQKVRNRRDELMRGFEWRYIRYEREKRLNLNTTDDIKDLDEYMQQLANVTNFSTPSSVVWPKWPIIRIENDDETTEEIPI